MNPLTRRDVIAHQALVPWQRQRQVEQDLLLCRSMAALFSDEFLRGQIAMRSSLRYDPHEGGAVVKEKLLRLLPE